MKLISILLQLSAIFLISPIAFCWLFVSLIPLFAAVYLLFMLYYHLKRKNSKWAKVIYVAVVLDAILNVVHMTLIYQQWPQHWRKLTFSERMLNSAKYDREDGYRYAITHWIYYSLMKEHDPDHHGIESAFNKRKNLTGNSYYGC